MNYIVLDLEWNQPKSDKHLIQEPFTLHGEIIQIGAVKLDENYHPLDTFKILVRPIRYCKMNRKVAKLTKIRTEDLQFGLPFQSALKHFRNWCGKDFAFFTWGSEDLRILQENIKLYAMSTKWLPNTYDIQIIFDNQITKENRQISLAHAMEIIEEPALEAHDALHDALNTVCVCMHLDIAKGLDEYPMILQQIQSRSNPSSQNKSEKDYATKTDALNDPEVIRFCCPKCGGMVSCKDIVKENRHKSIAIGQCENGDELFVRFNFKKWGNGRKTVSRILDEVNEDNLNFYLTKKQEAEEAAAAYQALIAAEA